MGTDPIDVRILPSELSRADVGKLVIVGVISIAPVVLAVLMQKAALRQSIVMHASHYGGEVCSNLSEFFGNKAAEFKTVYNVARM
jgi:hypothetical protein